MFCCAEKFLLFSFHIWCGVGLKQKNATKKNYLCWLPKVKVISSFHLTSTNKARGVTISTGNISSKIITLLLGIPSDKSQGTEWQRLHGSFKYVSCGALGCWGVTQNDQIFYRSGVSAQKFSGTSWTRIEGSLSKLRFVNHYI